MNISSDSAIFYRYWFKFFSIFTLCNWFKNACNDWKLNDRNEENISFLHSYLFLIHKQLMELEIQKFISIIFLILQNRINIIRENFKFFPKFRGFSCFYAWREACNASVQHNTVAWTQGHQRLRVLIKRPSSLWRVIIDTETTRTPSPRCDA